MRWAEANGISGAVWTPASYEVADVGPALVQLVEAGARPDSSLLADLASTDVRAAAEAFGAAYGESEGRTGYVVVWMDPASLKGTYVFDNDHGTRRRWGWRIDKLVSPYVDEV